jgi:hypothetical protein
VSGKSRDFSGSNPFLDADSIFVVGQPRSHGCGDGARATGGAADIGQWAGHVLSGCDVFGSVDRVSTQPHVGGLVQPAKSHWWQITASSAPDHPSRGITPWAS